MVGQQGGDYDPILDEVSDDDDDDAADVNMEEDDDAQHRAPPQPAVDASRGRRQDMDDEPPLEGYQRCVLGIACIMARYGMQTVIAQGYMLNIFARSLSHSHNNDVINYRTDLIGQGAYGIVYKGIRTRSGDIVAIKRIPFADSTPEGGVPCNVIREISLLRELDHPNVVKLLDIIQAHPGGLYLVFEFVAFDLKTFMDQHQTSDDISERVGLPVPTVRSFMRQMLAGVGFCHTYRVLHRDLKPHNVRICVLLFVTRICALSHIALNATPAPYKCRRHSTQTCRLWPRTSLRHSQWSVHL
jgi:Protein kinase domain